MIQQLEVGDLIILGENIRLIRDISYRNGEKFSFTFAILRRSWTNRPVTSYNRHDMRKLFGGLIKKNCPLVTNSLEAKVQYYIDAPHEQRDKYWKDYVTAEEVAGKVR